MKKNRAMYMECNHTLNKECKNAEDTACIHTVNMKFKNIMRIKSMNTLNRERKKNYN